MHCGLNDDISYCEVDGRLLFLDIARDRYFQIDRADEQRYLAQLDQLTAARDGPSTLGHVQHHVSAHTGTRKPSIAPRTSALEQPPSAVPLRPTVLLEATWRLLVTRRRLRTRGLKAVLNEASNVRSRLSAIDQSSSTEASTAALTFRRVRPYVPITTVCLLDSIALLHFLAHRGVPADLVFGVTGAPFSAHCWLQSGEAVLNDTLGNVESYTPIRVI